MQIRIQSLHFTSREELNDFINEKVEKLAHFRKDIQYADVVLRIDKDGIGDNKFCEIRLGVPGKDLIAKRRSDSFEKAVVETIEALKQQIEKMVTKQDSPDDRFYSA